MITLRTQVWTQHEVPSVRKVWVIGVDDTNLPVVFVADLFDASSVPPEYKLRGPFGVRCRLGLVVDKRVHFGVFGSEYTKALDSEAEREQEIQVQMQKCRELDWTWEGVEMYPEPKEWESV